MLAATIVLILEDELEGADEQIAKLEKYLYNRNCEITRKWQLFYCFSILFLMGLMSLERDAIAFAYFF